MSNEISTKPYVPNFADAAVEAANVSGSITAPLSPVREEHGFSLSGWLEEACGIGTTKKYYAQEMEKNGHEAFQTGMMGMPIVDKSKLALAALDFAGDAVVSLAGGVLGFAGSAVGTAGFLSTLIPELVAKVPYEMIAKDKSFTEAFSHIDGYDDARGLIKGLGNFFGSALTPVYAAFDATIDNYRENKDLLRQGNMLAYGEAYAQKFFENEKEAGLFALQSIAGYDSFNPNQADAVATSVGNLGALFVGGKVVKGVVDVATFDPLSASALQQAFSEAMNPGGKPVLVAALPAPVPAQVQSSPSGLQVELAEGGNIAQTTLQVLKDFAGKIIPNNRIVINTQGWESVPALTETLFAQLRSLTEESGVTLCLKTSLPGHLATEFIPMAEIARQQATGRMVAAGAKEDRVLVHEGNYEIGADNQSFYNPRRQVTLTRPFEIAARPVTNAVREAFYRKLAGQNELYALMATLEGGKRFALAFGSEADLARYKVSGDIPVELVRVVPEPDTLLRAIPENQRRPGQPAVSWLYDELVAYANAHGGRLPTAAEWEVAARTADGNSQLFDYSTQNGFLWNTSDGRFVAGAQKMADFGGQAPKDVGSFPPNRRGIYDMTGGVWEYLDTFWGEVDVNKTTGPKAGDYRSVRGGSSFDENEVSLHVANGFNFGFFNPVKRYKFIGGRPVWRP